MPTELIPQNNQNYDELPLVSYVPYLARVIVKILAGIGLISIEAASDLTDLFIFGAYGLRDIEALLFAGIGLHPIFGELTHSDKMALIISAIIPWLPPTLGLFFWKMWSSQ